MNLCLPLLAFAQIAFCSCVQVAPLPDFPVVTTLQNSSPPTWPQTLEPVRRMVERGVPNFGRLNDRVWRSGQPSRAGYQSLAAQGLKTVVNLRKESQVDKDFLPEGVRYFYIPITDSRPPTDAQAEEFLKIIADPNNWPVLVHCKNGEGRAGVMAALVRHSFDGWDYDRIMKEVSHFRVTHLGLIKLRMVGSQKNFIRHWAETTPASGSRPDAPKEENSTGR